MEEKKLRVEIIKWLKKYNYWKVQSYEKQNKELLDLIKK